MFNLLRRVFQGPRDLRSPMTRVCPCAPCTSELELGRQFWCIVVFLVVNLHSRPFMCTRVTFLSHSPWITDYDQIALHLAMHLVLLIFGISSRSELRDQLQSRGKLIAATALQNARTVMGQSESALFKCNPTVASVGYSARHCVVGHRQDTSLLRSWPFLP
jgi:hypothetical protein